MPKIAYRLDTFGAKHAEIVRRAAQIIDEYSAMGYQITLRQLYYQFVARDLLPNKDQSYKMLGGVIARARYAGLIDWRAITDRTRNVRQNPHWTDPGDILNAVATQFRVDTWDNQPARCECWIEKDALIGVVEPISRELDVACFSCRGYTSVSEVWEASQRLLNYARAGQTCTIFHMGDHDPSGVDMSRDIEERVREFLEYEGYGHHFGFLRIALNMSQIREYDPPPNPAKITDSRSGKYIDEYGDESWELDALPPDVLADLIRTAIETVRDDELYEGRIEDQEDGRRTLRAFSNMYPYLRAYADENGWIEDHS